MLLYCLNKKAAPEMDESYAYYQQWLNQHYDSSAETRDMPEEDAHGMEGVFRQFDVPVDSSIGHQDELWKKEEEWFLSNQPPPAEAPRWSKAIDGTFAMLRYNMGFPYDEGGKLGKEQKEYMRNSILKAAVEAKSNNLAAMWPFLEPRAKLVLIRSFYSQEK